MISTDLFLSLTILSLIWFRLLSYPSIEYFWFNYCLLQIYYLYLVLFNILYFLIKIDTLFMNCFSDLREHIYDIILNSLLGKSLNSVSLWSASKDLSYSFVWNILCFFNLFDFMCSFCTLDKTITSPRLGRITSYRIWNSTQTSPKLWVPVKLVLVYTTIFVLSALRRLRCVKSYQCHKSGRNAHMPIQAPGELLIAR